MSIDLSQFCALYIDVRIEVETQGTTSPNPTEITRVRKRAKGHLFHLHDQHRGGCYMRVYIHSCYSRPKPQHSPSRGDVPPAHSLNVSHLAFLPKTCHLQTSSIRSIGCYRPQDCVIGPSQLPTQAPLIFSFRQYGDDLTEQDKVRITLKFNLFVFPPV